LRTKKEYGTNTELKRLVKRGARFRVGLDRRARYRARMARLRFLIVDGNPRERRQAHIDDYGLSPGDAYGGTLMGLAPAGSSYDICLPAFEGANLPTGAGIADYDGVALTGSSLHLWNREPAVERQIALAREVYRSGAAFFGSCWGVQMAAVAAGGDVRRNPLGRELGFARNIAPTEAGRAHPLLAGRPAAFDAPAIHLDVIATAPADCTVLAANALAPVQAAEIRHEGGVFWGVQYHPEFTLREVGVILRRIADLTTAEGFSRTPEEGRAFAEELIALDADRARADIAWRAGLDAEILDDARRVTELRNWIERQVKPMAAARGRG
jgi:GMP synthase (glutamine-hydrolysing)